MTLYHYCIEKKDGDKQYVIDGVASLEKPIRTMDDYRAFKALVVKDGFGPRNVTPAEWTILSLTVIGED